MNGSSLIKEGKRELERERERERNNLPRANLIPRQARGPPENGAPIRDHPESTSIHN
jgi:hypothetical protein